MRQEKEGGKILAKLQRFIESMEKRNKASENNTGPTGRRTDGHALLQRCDGASKKIKMKKSKWEKAAEWARLEEKNDNETKAKG